MCVCMSSGVYMCAYVFVRASEWVHALHIQVCEYTSDVCMHCMHVCLHVHK